MNMSAYPMEPFLYTLSLGDTLWLIGQRYHTTFNALAAVNPGVDLNNLYVGQAICVYPGYGYPPQSFYAASYASSASSGTSQAEVELRNQLRLLWEQHVVWTRLTILSMVFSLPDVDLVTNRLLRNPKDFEAALKPFYGEKIASQFAALFTTHLVIASQLVKAAKAGDAKAAAEAEKSWYANADQIAAFLGSINPYWSANQWRTMLHEHLALTKAEAVAMLTKNYGESISLFDEIEKQALEMADVMAYGIIRQFPDRFM